MSCWLPASAWRPADDRHEQGEEKMMASECTFCGAEIPDGPVFNWVEREKSAETRHGPGYARAFEEYSECPACHVRNVSRRGTGFWSEASWYADDDADYYEPAPPVITEAGR